MAWTHPFQNGKPRQIHPAGALLSLLVPGLGQLWQGRLRRGFILFLVAPVGVFAFCHSGALSTFSGAALLVLSELVWWLISIGDALLGSNAEPMPSPTRRFLAIGVLVGFTVFFNFPAGLNFLMGDVRLFAVPSTDMSPTLQPGDIVVVSLRPQGDVLQHQEVVAFRHDGTIQARRIIGLGGDRVQELSGHVWLNGRSLSEPFARPASSPPRALATCPMVGVADDQLYVMGDNRAFATGSQTPGFGMVNVSQVLGPVQYVLWSNFFSHLGSRPNGG